MEGPTRDNLMNLESMQALGPVTCWDAGGGGINGYVDLLQNPRFRSDVDPAALLVSGAHTHDRQTHPRGGARRIGLLDQGGSLRESRDVTPGVPVVDVVEPAGGTVTAVKSVTLRWMATDPDGDALAYSLALRDDGGGTWERSA